MSEAAILIRSPRCGKQTFVPPAHGDSIRNLALIVLVVSEEKALEECERRTMEPAYTISTYEPKGSGELKMYHNKYMYNPKTPRGQK